MLGQWIVTVIGLISLIAGIIVLIKINKKQN